MQPSGSWREQQFAFYVFDKRLFPEEADRRRCSCFVATPLPLI